MTPDDILAKVREARAICDAATPGPWGVGGGGDVYRITDDERAAGYKCGVNVLQCIDEATWNPDDSEFAAAARAGWPEALDFIEALVGKPLPPDPPPGTMRVTASVPVTYDVRPEQIAAYLRGKGWSQATQGSAVWTKGQLDLHFLGIENAKRIRSYLLPALAGVEHRSTGEVLRDIAATEVP